MNTTKRFVYGIISSALLAVGLVRAADQFDPMNQGMASVGATPTGMAPDSGSACWEGLSAN